MSKFVEAVWNLLLGLGPQVKYDLLASNAIQFLASVADRQQYKALFEDPNVLGSICEKIIVPNIEMREVGFHSLLVFRLEALRVHYMMAFSGASNKHLSN